MPGLTNEPTGIIDQPAQNVSSTAGASSSSSHADVYIIPDYSISRTHPQHILVLPFVPHPPTTAAASNFQPPPQPPPNYFCTNNHRASTPAYNDPPPDYEAVNPHQSYINHGASFESSGRLTPSCSCMTQLTSIADDCGSNGHHPVLQGIYDNGLHQCGLDRNEALTASYLYPELLNVTSSFNARRSQRLLRPQSSSLSSSSGVSTTTVSSIQHQQYVDEQRQYLTVKKWVIVVLVLMLLMTVSLLVGISLQHFQLLRKFLDSKTTTQAYIPSTTTELPTLSYDKVDESENYIPK